MKTFLQLTGIMLCAATLHGATADSAAPFQTKQGEDLHAAITDMPDIVDMSYADPKTWNSLAPAGQVYDHSHSHTLAFEEAELLNSIRLWRSLISVCELAGLHFRYDDQCPLWVLH